VRGHVRRGELDERSGWEILHTFRWLGVTRHGTFSMLDRVWELRDNLTAYDATYVASPRRCSAPRYGDGRISRAPGMRCPVTVLPADRGFASNAHAVAAGKDQKMPVRHVEFAINRTAALM
jgi:predicted nucleic acid-binding protein